MYLKNFYNFVFVLVVSLFCTTPASGNTDALLALLKALHEDGTIDAETYEMVRNVAEADLSSRGGDSENSETIRQVVKKEVAEVTKDQPKVSVGEKFEVQSADGDFSLRVGGRIQLDAATSDEDGLRHNDGTEFRRARLFVQGRLWRDWGYKLQYDFTATGLSGLQDAFIDYNGFDTWKIRAGHFKEPFSLQNMTSSKYITFMERGLPYLFVPGRNIGVALLAGNDRWSFGAGIFGEGRDGASSDNDEGYGGSARVTLVPFTAERLVSHLGLSASWRASGSDNVIRFRERPESHVTDTRLVDTGNIDTSDYSRFAAEAAWVQGPFSLAGEYYHLFLDRENAGNPGLEFDGYYLETGWFLTGESANYSANSGSFGRITPRRIVGKGGIGAWQLAARFSHLDLTDEDISGGEISNFTLGLNWFATPNIRFAANYVNVLDVDGGPADGDEPSIFQVRSQVEF